MECADMFNTTATTTYLLYKAKTRTRIWSTQPRLPRTLCIKQSRNANMGNVAVTTINLLHKANGMRGYV